MEKDEEDLETTFNIVLGLESEASFSDLVSQDRVHCIRELQENLKRKILEKGSEHPSVLAGLNELAENYVLIYQFDKAETIFHKTWMGYKRIYGSTNCIVPHTLSRLAYCWHEQRMYKDAKRGYRDSLSGYESLLGENNKDTARVVEEYAETLYHLDEVTSCKQLYERLLKYYDTYFSREDSNCLRIVDKLVHIYLHLEMKDAAEKLCSESLDCCIKVFGPDHPTTQSSVAILAELKYSQGKHDEAEKMYRLALECNMKNLGQYHLDTIKIINAIAEVKFNAQDYESAERYYRQVLDGFDHVLGVGSTQSFQTMHCIGKCLFRKNQLIDARLMLLDAYNGRRKLLGPQHLDTVFTLYELGKVYHYESHWRHKPDAAETRRKAEVSLFAAVEGFEKNLGDDHPTTIEAIKHLADFLWEGSSSLDEMVVLYRRVLVMEKKFLGDYRVATLETMYKLATILEMQRKHDEAAELFLQVHEGYNKLEYMKPVEREEAEKYLSDDEIIEKFKERSNDSYLQHCNSLKRLML